MCLTVTGSFARLSWLRTGGRGLGRDQETCAELAICGESDSAAAAAAGSLRPLSAQWSIARSSPSANSWPVARAAAPPVPCAISTGSQPPPTASPAPCCITWGRQRVVTPPQRREAPPALPPNRPAPAPPQTTKTSARLPLDFGLLGLCPAAGAPVRFGRRFSVEPHDARQIIASRGWFRAAGPRRLMWRLFLREIEGGVA